MSFCMEILSNAKKIFQKMANILEDLQENFIQILQRFDKYFHNFWKLSTKKPQKNQKQKQKQNTYIEENKSSF